MRKLAQILAVLFTSVAVLSTPQQALACRVPGGVCLAIAWCMGPDGREFAGPLRAAAQSGDPTGISSDTQACQSKYGQQHGKDYSKQASGCTADEFRALAKKALGGSAACRR
jgi:hypothetical protein